MQPPVEVAPDLDINRLFCIRRQPAREMPGSNPLRPATVAGNGAAAWLQPDQSMRRQWGRCLSLSIGLWQVWESPGATSITIFQEEINM